MLNLNYYYLLYESSTLYVYGTLMCIILLILTASIKAFISFSDKMPEDLAESFKNDFIREYMKRKIVYEAHHCNENCTFVLDLYTLLVVSARKPNNA